MGSETIRIEVVYVRVPPSRVVQMGSEKFDYQNRIPAIVEAHHTFPVPNRDIRQSSVAGCALDENRPE